MFLKLQSYFYYSDMVDRAEEGQKQMFQRAAKAELDRRHQRETGSDPSDWLERNKAPFLNPAKKVLLLSFSFYLIVTTCDELRFF